MHYLITGANRGIGLALTRQVLARGEHVLAACRHPQDAAALHEWQSQYGTQITLIALDVSDPASIAASVDAVRQVTGTVDVLINNAGISGGLEPLGTITQDTLLANYKVNAAGPVLMAQQYLDLLKAGAGKKLVNITTGISSLSTRDKGGMYSYTASKTALNMLTKNLSFDLAPFGITAVVLDPGWVQTDMGGPDAWITPEESATGILRVIDQLTLDDTGKFFHYTGTEIAW